MEKLPQTVSAFDKLLAQEKIERKDLDSLGPDEKTNFMDMLYNKLTKLAEYDRNEERDALVGKTIALLDNDFIWQHNHTKVIKAMKAYSRDNGTVPTNAQLAATCKLSRRTIREHLMEYNNNESWIEQNQAINIVSQSIMGNVIKAALKGDLKAAKLYLDNTKAFKTNNVAVNTQNNYVQLNKTVINQQVIQQLKPEQLQLIEQIIAGVGSKTE